jgi:UDP-N-acetylmuramate--alanine ligase
MKMPQNIGLVHFVGIGGIGMSGIAEVLEVVVISTAIKPDNPELDAARERGCRSCAGPRCWPS